MGAAAGGDWGPAPFRALTERLSLTSFRPEDAHDIAKLAGDWRVARETTQMPHPYEPGAAARWVANDLEARQLGRDYTFAIRDRFTNELMGAVGLRLSGLPMDQSAELGYWLGTAYWGRGYATEAVRAALIYGQKELGLSWFTAKVFVENPTSARVLEKAGFAHVGIRSEKFPDRGGRRRVHKFVWGEPPFQRLKRRLVALLGGWR